MPPKFQRWKNIMKAYPFEEKRLLKWTPPFIVQPKYDGIRCRAVPLENGQFILLSSEENVIYSVPHINESLKKLNIKAEFDGELYHHGMSFELITSITSRTVNIHPDYEAIQFHIFDVVDPAANQTDRIMLLQHWKKEILKSKNLELSPYWIADNLSEIMRVYDKLIEFGYEGIIVRHCQAPYIRKRSTFVMKFKPKKEDTYVISGYVEEHTNEGIAKGQLGALVCDSGNSQTFRVGSGFTEEQRINLWKDRENLVGKEVRIGYQHMTSGRGVPRFPVFVEVVENG